MNKSKEKNVLYEINEKNDNIKTLKISCETHEHYIVYKKNELFAYEKTSVDNKIFEERISNNKDLLIDYKKKKILMNLKKEIKDKELFLVIDRKNLEFFKKSVKDKEEELKKLEERYINLTILIQEDGENNE